jgi:hypothetical protein
MSDIPLAPKELLKFFDSLRREQNNYYEPPWSDAPSRWYCANCNTMNWPNSTRCGGCRKDRDAS